jgi:hypothetical protein
MHEGHVHATDAWENLYKKVFCKHEIMDWGEDTFYWRDNYLESKFYLMLMLYLIRS